MGKKKPFGLPVTQNLYKRYEGKQVIIYSTNNSSLYGTVQNINGELLEIKCISFMSTGRSVEPIENNAIVSLNYVVGIEEITRAMLNDHKRKYDVFSKHLDEIIKISKNSEKYIGRLERVSLDGIELDVLEPRKGELISSGKAFIYFPISYIFVLSKEEVEKWKNGN